MARKISIWLISVLLMLGTVVYQRLTGPTHPVRGSVEAAGARVRFKLPRSDEGGERDLAIRVKAEGVAGRLEYCRYRSHDTWTSVSMIREGEDLVGWIPRQPPAGKVLYRVTLLLEDGADIPLTREPVIVRFRGAVPGALLWAHIVLMFATITLCMRTGLGALAREPRLGRLPLATFLTLLVGGGLLGPLVQLFSFGAYWTGWPLGTDLTDNKTAVALVVWAVALWRMKARPPARGWVLLAVLVQLAIYLVPHSLLGSELDYTKMGG